MESRIEKTAIVPSPVFCKKMLKAMNGKEMRFALVLQERSPSRLRAGKRVAREGLALHKSGGQALQTTGGQAGMSGSEHNEG